MERKKKTFTFNGFGFPIHLIDAPMKKIDEEWVVDINMGELQRAVFKRLIHKPSPLTGKELRFMRLALEMSEEKFSEKTGHSKSTVEKWENDQSKIHPGLESYIRIFLFESFFESLKEKGLGRLIREITPQRLNEAKNVDIIFSVDSKELKTAI